MARGGRLTSHNHTFEGDEWTKGQERAARLERDKKKLNDELAQRRHEMSPWLKKEVSKVSKENKQTPKGTYPKGTPKYKYDKGFPNHKQVVFFWVWGMFLSGSVGISLESRTAGNRSRCEDLGWIGTDDGEKWLDRN